MFLWWSSNNKEKQELEEKQQQVDELRDELANAKLTRPSNVSKAKYNKYVVTEDNQAVGNAVREENSELMSQRDTTRSEFLEAGHERAQAAREQRGA